VHLLVERRLAVSQSQKHQHDTHKSPRSRFAQDLYWHTDGIRFSRRGLFAQVPRVLEIRFRSHSEAGPRYVKIDFRRPIYASVELRTDAKRKRLDPMTVRNYEQSTISPNFFLETCNVLSVKITHVEVFNTRTSTFL
jgi:hypothetical protein